MSRADGVAGSTRTAGRNSRAARGGAHPRVSAEKGTAGFGGMAGRAVGQKAREKPKKWAHPGFTEGAGLQPGSSKEDANVGKTAQGAGAQSGARRVALEARKPSRNLVEQSRSELKEYG